jgi:hypothetical protein
MRCLVFLLICTVIIYGCRRDHSDDESVLYGTWVKGNHAGDTLQFFKRGDKNIFVYNASFNASLPVIIEREYIYRNGKPGIKNFWTSGNDDFYTIQSFAWKQHGKEFQVRGLEMYHFISSSEAIFTFRKVQ